YYGTPINNSSPQPIDTAAQVASRIAAAINGALLGEPALIQSNGAQTTQTSSFVHAAVTGNHGTLTNVAMNSAVALQVPFTGSQSNLAGETFSIKGNVFQFFSGDSLQLNVVSGQAIADGTTFSVTYGGATVTFEFALNSRVLIDGNWPINYTA